MILEEFDLSEEAIISPHDLIEKVEGMPKVAVTCFWGEGFNRLVKQLGGEKIASIGNSNGQFPIYKVIYKGTEIAFYMSDMGAAGAGGNLEEIYAMGVEKVVVYGSCGVLDGKIEDCAIIIPNAAVRDEGMSYHYAPPSDEIVVNPKYISKFEEILKELGCFYTIGKVWTTDAFYRETKAKMERRKAAGCICVDMECSAMAAVAQFRKKDIFQFFYAEDNLDGEVWDKRSLGTDRRFTDKDRIALLAFEFAASISGVRCTNMNEICNVRRFQMSDADEVSKLIIKTLRTTNIKDYSKEYIENDVKMFTPEGVIKRASWTHFYVFSVKDIIVGCGAIGPYWRKEDESSLFNIFVLPEYQGKGVGRKIIETLEKDEFFLRAKRIEIPASITACEFYKKMGYAYKNGIDTVDEEQLIRLEKFR